MFNCLHPLLLLRENTRSTFTARYALPRGHNRQRRTIRSLRCRHKYRTGKQKQRHLVLQLIILTFLIFISSICLMIFIDCVNV